MIISIVLNSRAFKILSVVMRMFISRQREIRADAVAVRLTRDPLSLELGKHGIYVKRGLRAGCFLPQVATETGWSALEFLSREAFLEDEFAACYSRRAGALDLEVAHDRARGGRLHDHERHRVLAERLLGAEEA